MKYKRNWAFEQMMSVFFVDGTERQLRGCTDNKGRIEYIEFNDTRYTPEQFGDLGVSDVHFMVPASLNIKVPDAVLARTYLHLGKTISEGDTMKKVEIRGRIEKELRKRGHNLHCLMSEVSDE